MEALPRGGAWLLAQPDQTFTPERLSDDHRLIIQTTTQFAEQMSGDLRLVGEV